MQSVSEAAERLGMTIDEVRECCADGRLHAIQVGTDWAIGDEAIPTPPIPDLPLVQLPLDLELAFDHVVRLDLVEAWVPDVLRHKDLIADRQEVLVEVAARLEGNLWDGPINVAIPKTAFFSRPAQLLTFRDRVAYHALVASFAQAIDQQLSSAVFSARLDDPDSKSFTKPGLTQWNKWRAVVRASLWNRDRWLIMSDLTSYFDTVRHDLLLRDLVTLGVNDWAVDRLKMAMARWADVELQGLSQGPDVSRILGNFFLAPVDFEMSSGPWLYFRYMDDVRIIADTREDAVRAMRVFETETRRRGLVASAAKTKLLSGSAAADVDQDELRETAGYLFESRQYKSARKVLKRMFLAATGDDTLVDLRHSKFALWRLTLLRERSVDDRLFERLEELAPTASVVGSYLGGAIDRPRVMQGITDFLRGDAWMDSPFLLVYIFAAMLQSTNDLPPQWTDAARAVAHNRNEPIYLREVAFSVLARSSKPVDLAWMRGEANRESDETLVRAILVALFRVGAFDASLSSVMSQRSTALGRTVRFLNKQKALPSLVHNRASVPLSL